MNLKRALLIVAASAVAAAAGNASASEYSTGIQQQINHMEIVVKVDHLQEVDQNIVATDEALLQHYRDELTADQSRAN